MAGDRVFLEGMAFYGYHGVRAEERALGQRFLVDVALAVDLRPAGEADDLALTIDLFDVHERVRAVVEGPARLTIEAVAEAIAAALLAATPARAAAVTVRKAAPPLPGATLAASGVRIRRARPGARPR
jgi:dihydroneopterin aldolase